MATTAPATVWQPTNGNGDFDNTGVNDIIDTTGAFLVDTLANNIVDTGVTFTPIPATVWSQDESQ